MAARRKNVIANQVFIGCPWKTIKGKYEREIDSLRKTYPISFIIVGRHDKQAAGELFQIIKTALDSSSYAIFDATGGNANVSLEFGYAEGKDIEKAIYLSAHGSHRAGSDAAIIADLQGQKRNQYKQQAGLRKLLADFAKTHEYTTRFEKAFSTSMRRRSKGAKKRSRALWLKLVHILDGKPEARREDVLHKLQSDYSAYAESEINDALRTLHNAGLINVSPGRYSSVAIS